MPAPRELKLEVGLVAENPDPSARLEALNKTHAAVMVGGKFVIMNEVIDPIFKRPDITFSSVQDFRNRYSNDLIFYETDRGQKKCRSIATDWLASPNRRSYRGIVFSPAKETPGFYNLYRGLARKSVKGDWHLLQEHIHVNICGEIQRYSNYLLDWMADLVQNPGGIRPGVSIVLRGGRGTGKGLFATSLGKIFGSHFLHLRDQNHLTGRFNAHHKDALLLFADECFWAGNKTSEGLLKGIITEETIQIEAKGKDPFEVENHIRLIVASNEDWVIPAGMDERRFFCLDLSEDYKQDISYWNPIWEETRKGGIEAMLYDLLRREYDPISLKTPPRTKALVSQIEYSMNSVQKWWLQRLMEGCQLRLMNIWETRMATEKLHSDYLLFCKDTNERYPESCNIFGKSVRSLCQVHHIRMPAETICGRRPMGLLFNTLTECRKQFEAVLGAEFDWGEDEK
jgi:hypothetical protein